MKEKLKAVFGLLVKTMLTAVVTLLLLEGGVRVVLYFSLNHYLTGTLPQPYERMMQGIGCFTSFGLDSEHKFDPLCYFIPRLGLFRDKNGNIDIPKGKEEREIRSVCMGDSTTYGVAVDYHHSRVYLPGKTLAEKYSGKKVRALNAGLSGASTKQSKRSFQLYLTLYHPDVLIRRFVDQEVLDTYSMVAKIVQENGSRYALQVELLRCHSKDAIFNTKQYADSAPYVRLLEAFKEPLRKIPPRDLFVRVDNEHLTEAGEALIAAGVAKIIISGKGTETFT